jgi:hypothetical protein
VPVTPLSLSLTTDGFVCLEDRRKNLREEQKCSGFAKRAFGEKYSFFFVCFAISLFLSHFVLIICSYILICIFTSLSFLSFCLSSHLVIFRSQHVDPTKRQRRFRHTAWYNHALKLLCIYGGIRFCSWAENNFKSCFKLVPVNQTNLQRSCLAR